MPPNHRATNYKDVYEKTTTEPPPSLPPPHPCGSSFLSILIFCPGQREARGPTHRHLQLNWRRVLGSALYCDGSYKWRSIPATQAGAAQLLATETPTPETYHLYSTVRHHSRHSSRSRSILQSTRVVSLVMAIGKWVQLSCPSWAQATQFIHHGQGPFLILLTESKSATINIV